MEPKRALSEIEKLDPFERYRSLSNDEDWLLTQRLFALHGPWIREQLEATGAGLIIVCDRKVVYTKMKATWRRIVWPKSSKGS